MRYPLLLLLAALLGCDQYDLVDPGAGSNDVAAFVNVNLVQEDTARYEVFAGLARGSGQATPLVEGEFRVNGTAMAPFGNTSSVTQYGLTMRRAAAETPLDSLRVQFPSLAASVAPFETALALPRREDPLVVALTADELILHIAPGPTESARIRSDFKSWQLTLQSGACRGTTDALVRVSSQGSLPRELHVPRAWFADAPTQPTVVCLSSAMGYQLADAPYPVVAIITALIIWHVQPQ